MTNYRYRAADFAADPNDIRDLAYHRRAFDKTFISRETPVLLASKHGIHVIGFGSTVGLQTRDMEELVIVTEITLEDDHDYKVSSMRKWLAGEGPWVSVATEAIQESLEQLRAAEREREQQELTDQEQKQKELASLQEQTAARLENLGYSHPVATASQTATASDTASGIQGERQIAQSLAGQTMREAKYDRGVLTLDLMDGRTVRVQAEANGYGLELSS